jgi:hemerythrin-like domain-containing protein
MIWEIHVDNQMSDTLVAMEMKAHHLSLQNLCERLEAIADNLPDNVDLQECLVLARDIYPVVKKAHDFEENQFFPILEQRALNKDVHSGLERLRYQHWEDEDFAEELSLALGRIGRGEKVENVAKFSWMLRGFFSGLRRHMAYEADHFLPMLRTKPASQNNRSETRFG